MYIFFIGLFLLSQDCRDKYLDEVLKTVNSNKTPYLIALKVKSNGVEKNMILDTQQLYEFSKNKCKNDLDKYVLITKEKIIKGQSIDLISENAKQYAPKYFEIDSSVIKLSQNGRDSFIDHYFYRKKVLKSDYHGKELPTIVMVLFSWNYYVKNTFEGQLIIEDSCK
jgi:hypothetical protein